MDLDSIPPDIRGRGHPDRMWRMVTAAIGSYSHISRHVWGRRIKPVNRDLRLLVQDVHDEAQDVRSYRLVAPRSRSRHGELPRWQPGSHIDVLLPSGRRRQYSLCGDPNDRSYYRFATRRIADGGGGSRELHDTVEPGATLTIRGPRNGFPYVDHRHYVFIAGGIGITPILPMVRRAAHTGAWWQLVYAGRSRESMPFLAELTELSEAAGPDNGRLIVRPDTEHGGAPPTTEELLKYVPRGSMVYCCGPSPMIAMVRAGLPATGAEALHFERFSPPPIENGVPFEVELRRSQQLRTVPADRSALSVVREVVPEVPFSCQQGFCGTCRTRVISGDVEHRDHVVSGPGEPDTMTICVSRSPGGRVVLDI